MVLGKALKQAREAAGFSQEELAERAGLHRTSINLLEQGQRCPSVKVFVDICRAMGVRAADVLARAEDDVAAQPRSRRGYRS